MAFRPPRLTPRNSRSTPFGLYSRLLRDSNCGEKQNLYHRGHEGTQRNATEEERNTRCCRQSRNPHRSAKSYGRCAETDPPVQCAGSREGMKLGTLSHQPSSAVRKSTSNIRRGRTPHSRPYRSESSIWDESGLPELLFGSSFFFDGFLCGFPLCTFVSSVVKVFTSAFPSFLVFRRFPLWFSFVYLRVLCGEGFHLAFRSFVSSVVFSAVSSVVFLCVPSCPLW